MKQERLTKCAFFELGENVKILQGWRKRVTWEHKNGIPWDVSVVADAERYHLEEMENIHDFVETPDTCLAWGEFSNIREH